MKTLFDNAPLSHTGDLQSSFDAAETVNLKRWHDKIYDALKRHDRPEGYTAKELAEIMSEDYFKIAKRLRKMADLGLIQSCTPRPSLIGTAYKKNGDPIFEQTWRAI